MHINQQMETKLEMFSSFKTQLCLFSVCLAKTLRPDKCAECKVLKSTVWIFCNLHLDISVNIGSKLFSFIFYCLYFSSLCIMAYMRHHPHACAGRHKNQQNGDLVSWHLVALLHHILLFVFSEAGLVGLFRVGWLCRAARREWRGHL